MGLEHWGDHFVAQNSSKPQLSARIHASVNSPPATVHLLTRG